MCSPMPDTPFDELGQDVPPSASSGPSAKVSTREIAYFDIDEWRWSDSTCNWPNCFKETNA
jgi:hypothetical protein